VIAVDEHRVALARFKLRDVRSWYVQGRRTEEVTSDGAKKAKPRSLLRQSPVRDRRV